MHLLQCVLTFELGFKSKWNTKNVFSRIALDDLNVTFIAHIKLLFSCKPVKKPKEFKKLIGWVSKSYSILTTLLSYKTCTNKFKSTINSSKAYKETYFLLF